MRADSIGFFWNDAPIPKPPKPEKEKRQPPERTWERSDYLPGIEEARQWPIRMFTEYELMSEIGNELICDVECYPNYFEVGFTSVKTGRVMVFVMTDTQPMDFQRLRWVCENFTLITFNGNHYDIPMLSFALAGHDCKTLWQITEAIILFEEQPWQVMRSWKVKRLRADHIDIKEVCPLHGSLKAYGGRIAVPKLQDLPFRPGSHLTPDQMLVTTWYNVNDMTTTAFVHSYLKEPLTLRTIMSSEYGVDLRSKSDAQIAETVIGMQVEGLNGVRPQSPEIPVGTTFRYDAPDYLRRFQTPAMQQIVKLVCDTPFIIGEDMRIAKPPQLNGLQVQIGQMVYTLGIGGLHSTEKKTANRAVGGYKIEDIDMASFYPYIIINQKLYPPQLGPAFLTVYAGIVNRRIAAKKAGDKATANSLKITINGAYGKLGQPHSILYAPGLLTQVTLTGQLSILLLIEMFETYGIQVISANTDGIAIRYHESQQALKDQILTMWSKMVEFEPEITPYLAMYNKDVNNYIAVKPDGKCKTKGLYANPWNDKKDITEHLKKNPTCSICIDAIEALLTKGTPVEETITKSRDFARFLAVRTVKGGAVKDGEFLGKTVRWYYATGQAGEIITANTGHTVPMSEGAKPCMTLPATFPDDVDFDWYIQRAERHLKDIGYYG